MDKMRMESVDMTAQNIDKIGALFPNCITETVDKNGKPKKAINFELLKQMLSGDVLEGDEAYEFTWVGKKAAIVEANKPIRKTLRPCVEESKDWDTTKNLYIEGDNLEVLKLLQESYLGKVKMIYIDPPYNTGHDFIYADDFMRTQNEENRQMGMYDDEENRLFKNTDTNGKFHSDWCSMICSRLMLARNLLSENGVIFISMDDGEIGNLRSISDEIFGATNFVANVIWEKKYAPANDAKWLSDNHDHILVYAKNKNNWRPQLLPRSDEMNSRYINRDNDPRGGWKSSDLSVKTYSAAYDYPITTPSGRIVNPPGGACWRVSKDKFAEMVEDNRIWFGEDGNNTPSIKRFLTEVKDGRTPTTIWKYNEVGHNQEGRQEVKKIFNDKGYFDGPKPVRLLSHIIEIANLDSDSIVLDFFSGSASTAQAVMQMNSVDNGKRKYIMVQLPEKCDEGSDAYRDGYVNICEIGKERIRRAGDKIKAETGADIDYGFRVLKLDESNMTDVYYSADEYDQQMLSMLESNVKPDRTDLDLLFSCLLEWGLPLSMPYKSEQIESYTVHIYNDGDLIACFDKNLPDSVVKAIAKRQPLRAVFRDSSFANSPAKINVTEIFKLLAPNTRVKVL